MNVIQASARCRERWNEGKLVGQKAPLRLRDIWAIRIRIQLAGNIRALAQFNLAIDSGLRSCDLIKLRVRDIAHGEHVAQRAIILQQKTAQCSSRSRNRPEQPSLPSPKTLTPRPPEFKVSSPPLVHLRYGQVTRCHP